MDEVTNIQYFQDSAEKLLNSDAFLLVVFDKTDGGGFTVETNYNDIALLPLLVEFGTQSMQVAISEQFNANLDDDDSEFE